MRTRGYKPRILVTEDEVIVARDIQQQLVELGYEPVGHATRGAQAVELVGELRPDLVLMDIRMAGAMDGIAAAQAIRERFSLPVVFLTAFAEEETFSRAILTDPFGYIVKPFSERELHTVIEMALYKHQLDQKLRQSEERLRLVLQGSRDGVWDIDLIKNEGFYSARWWEMLGYAPDELPAGDDPWQTLIHPDDVARSLQLLSDLQASDDSHYELEIRLRHKAGHYVPVLSRGIVLRDAAGRAVRVAGTNTDLTARKRAEAATAAVEARLRQSQKLESIGRLAGGIAHDFNNLLAAILGNAALLQGEVDAPAQHEMLRQITEAGNRAAGLTRQLLLFSRREVPVRHEVDLNQVVAELVKVLQPILGEHVSLQLDLAQRPQLIDADASMMDQILLNLVVNGRDAMPEGGHLSIRTEAVSFAVDAATGTLVAWIGGVRRAGGPRVTVDPAAADGLSQAPSPLRAGDFTCLSVTDDGCGMPPEIVAHIFEPFFTTKEAGRGTGLGLATVYGVAQQHQGWIEVESQPGAGTTFRVYLPRSSRAHAPAHAAPSAQQAPPARGETIFLVEDEGAVRKFLRTLLGRAGYRVIECASGSEALELWPRHKAEVDLLLTDIVMPGGVNGVQLAQALRAETPGLRIILMSGFDANLGQDRAELGSEVGFLAKPFATAALFSALRARLDAGAPPPG
jgi:hypothetical protein